MALTVTAKKRKIKKLIFITKGVCARCGKPLSVDESTLEHIFPKWAGGNNRLANLTVLCKECNLEKYDSIVYRITDYYRYIPDKYLLEYQKCLSNNITRYCKGLSEEGVDVTNYDCQELSYGILDNLERCSTIEEMQLMELIS